MPTFIKTAVLREKRADLYLSLLVAKMPTDSVFNGASAALMNLGCSVKFSLPFCSRNSPWQKWLV